MRTYLLLLFLLAVSVYSCTNKEAPKPNTGPETGCGSRVITSAYVYGIIQSKCTGCHSGSGAPLGADFSTLNKLKSFIGSEEATFRLRVTSAQADMPPRGAMSTNVRDSIGCWISNGMPD